MQINFPSYSKKVIVLILVSIAFKLLIAGLLELGNDEVYYWTYAIQPDWNHFDHPPMVGWMIRLFTLNLHWVSDISLRLTGIIGAGIATWFVFLTTKLIANERAGWFAALIYQSAVYTSIIAGLFILPDSPQMPFWTASLYCMATLLFVPDAENKISNWLILGALIGLAGLCKVHGLYLWVGFGICILLCRIKWLLNWRLYIAVLLTVLILLPIVFWNIQYDFITYKFHSDRVTHTSLQWDMLAREIVGEFAYQNPVIFILVFFALIAFLRNGFKVYKKGAATWLLSMSIPMILLFWGIAVFNPTLPHWSGPGFIPLFILAAIYLDNRSKNKMPPILIVAGSFLVAVLITAVATVRLSPINFGSQEEENYGEYCPTLDLTGWADFSDEYASLVKNDREHKLMKEHSFIVVPKWFPGGHLEFYTARKTGQTLIGIGPLQDIHKFAWLNKDRIKMQLGDDAYCIVPSNLPFDVNTEYAQYFNSIQAPVIINQTRNGGVVRHFKVYRLMGCKKIPQTQIK
ncbi:MAG: glycosyltransferase family 39 protein [Chitinophagaceae bacterium]|nr:glycosyltransferase family 39 protein [Chitinophagaceae bacterium]